MPPFTRHFTATAFIVDSKKRTLLLWHKRLNRWMPPGGHIDTDELPEDAARRECKEETGLDVRIIGDSQTDLFEKNRTEGRMLIKPIAMLLEEIPPFDDAQGGQSPAHQHIDFLFIAKPIDESQAVRITEQESNRMRWCTKAEVKSFDERTEIFSNVKEYIAVILA